MQNLNCEFCKSCKGVTAYDGFKFRGCFHEPYKGKWIVEVKECPLKDKELLEVEKKRYKHEQEIREDIFL